MTNDSVSAIIGESREKWLHFAADLSEEWDWEEYSMTQKNLAGWLKAIIIGLVVLALLVYGLLIPFIGRGIVESAPEFQSWFVPWLVFAWATAVPCFIAAFFAWKVAVNIGQDHSFCMENSVLLRRIAILAAVDSALVFVGDVVFILLGMNHASSAIALLMVVFLGAAVSVACAALSHLVKKAADLQQESDLTI